MDVDLSVGSSAQSPGGAKGGKKGEGSGRGGHGGGSGAALACDDSEDGGSAAFRDEYEISDSQDYIFLDISSQLN